MLMGVVVHINEIAQGNFVISLSTGEYPCQELIGGTGWRQGQSFPCAGDDLIECLSSHYANFLAHNYNYLFGNIR
jgi:hypothetical protein